MIINSGNPGKYTTVVVIGVQRGGTSMVAGVLRELGLPMGKNLGVNHEDPKFLPTNLSDILPVIKERNTEHAIWGWKMPHASEYILQAIPQLRNPHIIIVLRNLQAIVESQLKHSDTNFVEALAFSQDRHTQIVNVINKINCPLMLVNFENAISNTSGFLDEIKRFLPLDASPEMMKCAMDFVNPVKGYQRASFERWSYKVKKPSQVKLDDFELADAQRRTIHLTMGGGFLLRAGQSPRVELIPPVAEASGVNRIEKCVFYLSLLCSGEPQEISVRVNIGEGYSVNMTEKIKLHKGRNIIELSAVNIKGLFLFPNFDGDRSTTSMFNLYKKCQNAETI